MEQWHCTHPVDNQIVKVPQPLTSYPSSYSQRHANCYSPPRRFGQCAWPSNCTSAAVLASAARFVGSRTTHLDMTCPAYRYRTGYCICKWTGRESSTRSANSHLDSRFSIQIRFLSISRVYCVISRPKRGRQRRWGARARAAIAV